MSKSFPAPQIPKTPSKQINDMLNQRCNKEYDNPVKAAIAFIICWVYSAITKIYNIVNKDKPVSHTMWMVSCGVVGVGVVVAVTLAYNLVMSLSFLVTGVMYYGCVLLCLMAIGLSVAGMVFFDKDASKTFAPPAFPEGVGSEKSE